MAAVSIYVPCYNGEKYIQRCIESLFTLNPPADDIMVIDDGSTDRTAEIVRCYPQVRLVQQEKNKGLGAARNRGLNEAKYDLVASIDADVVVSKDWLGKMLNLANEFPNADVFGGYLEETVKSTLGDQWRCRHMPQHLGPKRIIAPHSVAGSNTLVRRSTILSVGGFDERMRTNGEDLNIAHKLREVRRTVIYDPEPKAYHLREDTIRSILRTYWAWYRHPWAVLFPHKSWFDVYNHLRKRHWRQTWEKACTDWRERNWKLLVISLWSFVDQTWREIRFFMRQLATSKGAHTS